MKQMAVIFGLKGLRLTAAEKAFFRDANPWGFILFARNIETPDQVQALTQSLRDCVGRDCLIFIDQEGGRVQRLRPPHWHDYPSLSHVASDYQNGRDHVRRAMFLHHRLISADLRALGVTANCAPVLDIPVEGADPIISDRAMGLNAAQIIDLAQPAMAGLMTGGVAPVIKHIPGHGRATVDSHLDLPHISTGLEELIETDFYPFKALKTAPMAMTAHIILEAVDKNRVLTLSSLTIDVVIRKYIEFDGLLMSDDLGMNALSGSLKERAEQSLAAGCDVALQCSGEFLEMVEVAKGAKYLAGKSLERAEIANHCAEDPRDFDYDAARSEYLELLPVEANIV